MTLAEKLKKLRDLRQLTTEELSTLSGVHQTTISAIETGRHPSPRLETIERLSRALRVSPLYFFEERSRTPFDLIDNLPSDITEFLLHEESLPYLLLSKEAHSRGISSKTIEQLIKVLSESREEKQQLTTLNKNKKSQKKLGSVKTRGSGVGYEKD